MGELSVFSYLRWNEGLRGRIHCRFASIRFNALTFECFYDLYAELAEGIFQVEMDEYEMPPAKKNFFLQCDLIFFGTFSENFDFST